MTPGERLGPYELVTRIGAGGMGDVWRARDTRLDRSVAVKILPAEFAANAQFRLRFEREARMISQLDHPNICALYDVGENYLVMELLEGESLAERVARGPMPLSEVMRIGAQVADALDRAHRAQIVHRDVKPANIVLTRSGAKLLDFGVAKAAAAPAVYDDQTLYRPLTDQGIVVGTLQYMAPEQLGGGEADARTDIFGLGLVLYEMATGKPAFDGPTRAALVAGISFADPRPISELQPLAPPALEHLIQKCLNKEPDDRWQSAHDVAAELRWIGSGGSQPALTARIAGRRRTSLERLAWLAALLVCVGAAGRMITRPGNAPNVIEAAVTMTENGGIEYFSGPPALSPDGKSLVYAARDPNGRRMLWLRRIDRGPARPIEGSEDGFRPFWSPDGRFIGFSGGDGNLRKIPVTGGQSDMLASNAATNSYGGWSWNRDDVILYVSPQPEAAVHRVAASGGPRALVLRAADIGAQLVLWPSFLPDGNRFIVLAWGGKLAERGQAGIWLATLDGSEKPRFVVAADTNALYVEPGYVLFGRGGTLRALPFDAKKLQAAGEAVAIAPVQTYDKLAVFTASNDGLLLYQPVGASQLSELLLMNRKGEKLRGFGPVGFYWSPALSPDGQRVAVDRSSNTASGDLWIIDSGGSARFSFDSRNESAPVWSPDGRELIYSIDARPGVISVLRKPLGEGSRVILDEDRVMSIVSDWSPDGRHLTIDRATAANFDAMVWAIEERKWITIAAGPGHEGRVVFSPDGKWVVYQSDESGRFEIYAQRFPPSGAKYQVSVDGGVTPRWLETGEISWADLDGRLHVASVDTASGFRVGHPTALFRIEQKNRMVPEYDVTRDGNFLVNMAVPVPPRPLTLVLNWHHRISK